MNCLVAWSGNKSASTSPVVEAHSESYVEYVIIALGEMTAFIIGIPLVGGLIGLPFGKPDVGAGIGAVIVAIAFFNGMVFGGGLFIVGASILVCFGLANLTGATEDQKAAAVGFGSILGTIHVFSLAIALRAAELQDRAKKTRNRSSVYEGCKNESTFESRAKKWTKDTTAPHRHVQRRVATRA